MSQLKEKMVKDGHLGGYIPGGDSATWCPALWNWALKKFAVRSMLDVGCGEGHSARFFQDAGCDILGVEGCAAAIENSAIRGSVAHHDFTRGPFLPARPYDLVWSCEFLEHVERQYVPHILATLAHAAKAILITHAFPSQSDGYHHVNCRPSAYWIRLIEALGYECDVPLSREARTVTLQDYLGINHFARSGLVFVKSERPAASGMLAGLHTSWSTQVKSCKINWGFRWSSAYWQQKRRKRQAKRDSKRVA